MTTLAGVVMLATLLARSVHADQIHPIDPSKLTLPTPAPTDPALLPSKLHLTPPTPTPPPLHPPPSPKLILPAPTPNARPGIGNTNALDAGVQAATDIDEEYAHVKSILGAPTSDVSLTPDQRAWHRMYQGGEIFWTGQAGAHEVHGAGDNQHSPGIFLVAVRNDFRQVDPACFGQ